MNVTSEWTIGIGSITLSSAFASTLPFTESNFPFSPEVVTLCFSFLTVLKSTPVSQPLTKAAVGVIGFSLIRSHYGKIRSGGSSSIGPTRMGEHRDEHIYLVPSLKRESIVMSKTNLVQDSTEI
jgi:hypothetical protein